MESIAAPKSYLDCRPDGSVTKFLNPVSAHGQVSKEHVVLVHEHSALVHEHLALGTSTQHNYGWGTRPPEA